MQRIHRTIALLVVSGALIVGESACASLGGACGALFSVAMGLGVAVGSYYLTQAIS